MASAEDALATDTATHGQIGDKCLAVVERCAKVACTAEAFGAVCDGATRLQAEAAQWRQSHYEAAEASQAAQDAHAELHAPMQSQIRAVDECARLAEVRDVGCWDGRDDNSELRSGLRHREAELAEQNANLEATETHLEELTEARQNVTRQLMERDEALRFFTDGPPEDLLQDMATARHTAEELDERMRQVCEPLPAWQVLLQAEQKQIKFLANQRSATLGAWESALEASKICGQELRKGGRVLDRAQERLGTERAKRAQMRGNIRTLFQSLAALDGQLAELELEDGAEDVADPNSL